MRSAQALILVSVVMIAACGQDTGDAAANGDSGPEEAASDLPQETRGEGEFHASYSISGDVNAEHTENEAVSCIVQGEQLTVGVIAPDTWSLEVTVETTEPGSGIPATFDLRPSSMNLDEALTGEGSITWTEVGNSEFERPLLEGTFSATGLTSNRGDTADLHGVFTCPQF